MIDGTIDREGCAFVVNASAERPSDDHDCDEYTVRRTAAVSVMVRLVAVVRESRDAPSLNPQCVHTEDADDEHLIVAINRIPQT